MDKIVLLIIFSVIGSVTKGNAQLQCHVCNDCPNPNELDSNLVETCSTQTTTTTTEPTTTTTQDDITTPEDATTQTTDTSIITQTTPNLPPSTTPQIPDDTTTTQTSDGITTLTPPITPPSTTTQTPVIPPNSLVHKYLQVVRESLSGFRCFVVHRTVGDSVQVKRGCVLFRESREQTCADANSGSEPQLCELCASDACNDIDSSIASKYAVSLTVVLSSLFAIFTIR